jgi:ketosteroid isomerase-like protein
MRLCGICMFVLILLSLSCQQATTPKPTNTYEDVSSVEKEIRKIEDEWGIAVQRRNIDQDIATVERILANDWSGVTATGEIRTKNDALAQLRATTVSIESVKLAEIKVRVYGDTAVAVGHEFRTGDCAGRDLSGDSVWTDVFIKSNGRWQIVSSHSTMVNPDPMCRKK